jgi:hypothetical protein
MNICTVVYICANCASRTVSNKTKKQCFSGTFKAEVQRTEVQESFLAEVGNVQLGLEDSATSGKLGKDKLQRQKYF